MGYANLVNISCTDKVEFFCRLRDFLCKRNGTYDYSTTGIGWTLLDSSYAVDEDNPASNDWFVIYSPGEGGEDDLYFRFTYISNYLRVHGFQSWDATAHTGGNQYYTGNNFNLTDSGAKVLWVYGDLNTFAFVNKVATGDYDSMFGGKLKPGWDDQKNVIAECTSTLTAGSDVSITVGAMPTEWAVGREIYIRTTHNNDTSTVKAEKITIKTLVGNTITADLTNSYTANSALSDFVGYFVLNSSNAGGAITVLIDEAGTVGYGTGGRTILALTSGAFDPGVYEDRFFLLDIYYQIDASGLSGYLENIKWTPNYVAGFTYEDVIEEVGGADWRSIKCYSGSYLAFKEV